MGSLKWCVILLLTVFLIISECVTPIRCPFSIIQQVTAERSQAGKSLICTVCFPPPPEANGLLLSAVCVNQAKPPLPPLAYVSLPLSLDRLFSQSDYTRQSFVNAQARLGVPASTHRQIFTPKGKDLWDMSIRGTEEKTVGEEKKRKSISVSRIS